MLDAGQTIPPFVYLIPVLALFGPTRFTAIVAGDRLRRPGRDQAGRRRRQGGLADHDRGRPLDRHHDRGRRSPRSSSRWRAARSCWPPTRACSTSWRWSSSAAWSAPARSATTWCSAFSRSEEWGKGVAAGITIVLLGIMLDRITRAAARPTGDRPRPRSTIGPTASHGSWPTDSGAAQMIAHAQRRTRNADRRRTTRARASWPFAAVAGLALVGVRRGSIDEETEANESSAAEAGRLRRAQHGRQPVGRLRGQRLRRRHGRQERARLHGQLQGPQGGRLLAGLRHRRGRRRHRGLGPPRPGEEVLRRVR